ncbi:MAG TPA: hypothetical protein VGK64_25630 [Bryobacteraceae bacterium]
MKRMTYLAVAAALAAGTPLLAESSSASQKSADATRLLREVRLLTHDLNRDAATLKTYRLNRTSWQAHAHRLALAKEHINSIGERLANLDAMRGSVEPWQRGAIDSITPVAGQLAARTEAAIKYLNENQGRLFVPNYTEHLSAIAGHADQMQESISTHLDLASAQERMDKLRGA